MGSISVYQAAAKALDAAATTLADSQNKLLEHIFEGVDPTAYLPAFEADRDTMTELVIPEGVTKIGNGAFSGCEDLKTLALPNTVEAIGDRAFYGHRVRSLDIPASVKTIGESAFASHGTDLQLTLHEGLVQIGDNAFAENFEMESLVIPSSVAEIGVGAFRRTCIRHLTIGAGIYGIGDEAFYDHCCENIYIPDNVWAIINKAFGVDDPDSVKAPKISLCIKQRHFFGSPFFNLRNCEFTIRDATMGEFSDSLLYSYGGFGGTTVVHCTDGDFIMEGAMNYV